MSSSSRVEAWQGAAIVQPLLVLLAAILWQLPYFDRWISLMDEGHILAYADLLANGGELYRDATLLPLPGAFYLLEIAFRVFGPSMLLARWLVVIEFALLCVIAFELLRRLASARCAWAGVAAMLLYRIWAFPHWHMYSYSTTALLLLAAALLGLLFFFGSKRAEWLAGAGLLVGLGALCKQDYGAAGVLSMNLTLLIYLRTRGADAGASAVRVLAAFNLPAVAVGVATALHFARLGLFEEMLKQTVLNHLLGIATFEYTGLPPLWPLFSQTPELRSPESFTVYVPSIVASLDWPRVLASTWYRETILFDLAVKFFFYAPYGLAAVGIVRCWQRRRCLRDPAQSPRALAELALTLHAVGLVAILSRPVDWVHVLVLYWPLVCLGVFYLRELLPAARGARVVALLAVALSVSLFAGYTVFLGWQLRLQHPAAMASERASGVFVRPAEAATIGQAVEYVTAHSGEGEALAVLPYAPLVSFLADRPAPHRSAYILWPVEYYDSRQPEMIAAIEAGSGHSLYQVAQLGQFPRMSEFAPQLFEYLVERFAIEQPISHPDGGFLFAGLAREDRGSEGTPLLGPSNRPRALRVVRGDEVREIPVENWGRFLEMGLWPFRPVMAVRPLSRGRRTVVAVPLQVEAGTTLETAVGVHPMQWAVLPRSWVAFSIDAVVGGERIPVFSRKLDPQRNVDDRGWFEVEVPLDGFSDQHIELEFSTSCERRECEIFEAGGWEQPRVVRSRAAASAPP